MATVSTKSKFNPNGISFEQGLERIAEAVRRVNLETGRILTSRHEDVREAQRLLTVDAVPGGFTKWQLPVTLSRPSQLFVTTADPDIEVPEHSHDEGEGIRFIAGGSILYAGFELTAGDWMYIPQGARYSFKVGSQGAIMCYCYCCSCAGSRELAEGPREPLRVLGP